MCSFARLPVLPFAPVPVMSLSLVLNAPEFALLLFDILGLTMADLRAVLLSLCACALAVWWYRPTCGGAQPNGPVPVVTLVVEVNAR